ncbi:esterase-like activity of phytase family protein [Thalassovita aquimarina]|uniref:Esterase-like activity of phytase family protein n=1 Tax=Thalassovita aquimarina TaxID=2785917 RepID=A0ABS5HWN6_9RHOB|nr:esterase-like activity of phytase family protein [Thalassovita aquimarina]MBR9652933.1 esterase-like activity of phytase family protein [Thalassovita aquimarina]
MRIRLAIAIAALAAFGLTVSGSARPQEKARLLSAYGWNEALEGFGGISALELDADGKNFIAVTDRTLLLQGQLQRENGTVTGVTLTGSNFLLKPDGTRLTGWRRDSEGLALRSDGRLFVSFEAGAKVWAYSDPQGPATRLPGHPDFKDMPGNAALEALAIDDRGHLYAVPEAPLTRAGGLPLYRYDGTEWQIVQRITPSERFAPVGADFGPDGKFYLLERNFGGIGFRSRVRRFDLADFAPKGEVLFTSSLGQHDNLEGLSVWRDGAGYIRLTMVSDDNFKFFQRTEIVEYALAETLAKASLSH